MADESTGDRPPGFDVVVAAIEDTERGRRLLPQLLSLLDRDAEATRLAACWGICHVLAANPDMAPALVRRLLDRLDGESALPIELLAAYVWSRHPAVVDEEIERRRGQRDEYRPPSISGPSPRGGQLQRSVGNRSVGRTRMPGEGDETGPQQVYSDDEDDGVGGSVAVESTTDSERTQAEDEDQSAAEADDPLAPETTADAYEPPELLSVITYQSVFDSLSVVAGRDRTRYADVYRTLGVRAGDETGVGLTLYHRPTDRGARFGRELGGALERWHSVADHDNVVSVYDWGTEPQPWAVVDYTDQTLAGRDRLAPSLAHWNALALTDALTYAHENGVVHGGIEPGTVAYYGNVLDDEERQPPMLTNVSLLGVMRHYFDPRTRLDPRYAAPEYFDQRYGRVDHATDIYQLGAVCYRLFTGEPPYDGTYQSVRRGIVDGEAPRRPSEVADVPAGIDDVITKAMATEKLRRYESVSAFRAELGAIGGSEDGG